MSDDIRQLEEKIAYLERHVTEQDRAMLEFAEELARLRREFDTLRGQIGRSAPAAESGSSEERPPHY